MHLASIIRCAIVTEKLAQTADDVLSEKIQSQRPKTIDGIVYQ